MDETLITLQTFSNLWEASIVKAKLQNAGILCVLQDQHLASLYAQAVGGIKLQVRPEDALLATALMTLSEQAYQETHYHRCPRCQSTDIHPLPTDPENITENLNNNPVAGLTPYGCSHCGAVFEK